MMLCTSSFFQAEDCSIKQYTFAFKFDLVANNGDLNKDPF